MSPTPIRSQRGFTLIELLTVIAIIAILAAILIPAIGRVRQSAASATSSSNLHQLGAAMLMYTADNKGRFPPAAAQIKDETGSWAMLGSWDSFSFNYIGFQVRPHFPGNPINLAGEEGFKVYKPGLCIKESGFKESSF